MGDAVERRLESRDADAEAVAVEAMSLRLPSRMVSNPRFLAFASNRWRTLKPAGPSASKNRGTMSTCTPRAGSRRASCIISRSVGPENAKTTRSRRTDS